MLNRRTVLAATVAGVALTGTPAIAAEPTIKSIVDKWLPELAAYPTVAVGAFRGRRQYSVKGDTVFQIGSITKTFTAVALAVADRAGWLSVDDKLSAHLPRRFAAPEGITLAHLSSHTSGLDRLPPGLLEDPEFDIKDPYAHFSEEDLVAALKQTKLISEPGTKYLYSNYGGGLLGRALSADYAGVIHDRVTGPLGLKDTTITLSHEQRRRKAVGHDQTGASTPDWRLPALPGTGALYGTVDDLLRYSRAHLGEAPARLKPALDLVQRPRFEISPSDHVALGWHIRVMPANGHTMLWHDGGTGGFTAFTAFCPSQGTGVALLVDQAGANVLPAVHILEEL
jgi:serine-type D-Ala-D-Ala carboxypeptidase/endopeptidase